MRICEVPDCGKVHYVRGYCMMHYSRLIRNGTLEKKGKKPKKPCSVPGCKKPYAYNGYCGMHNQRIIKTGTLADPIKEVKLCKLPDCNNKHYCKGYCTSHYNRNKRWDNPYGGLYPIRRFSEETVKEMRDRRKKGEKLESIALSFGCSPTAVRMRVKDIPLIYWNRNRICSIEGCDKKHFGCGFCRTHYDQDLKERKKKEKEKLNKRNGVVAQRESVGFALRRFRVQAPASPPNNERLKVYK